MKILWVKTDFLHPTTRGGQIRTLEMLRQLHERHEVHYVAFDDPSNPEGLRRSSEYSTRCYPVSFSVAPKRSLAFAWQLTRGLLSRFPVAGMRYRSTGMRDAIARLVSECQFDVKVCDFLHPSINIEDMKDWILFQHNVETIIWERHAESGRTPAHRAYFGLQARRMFEWERAVCRSAAHVVAVSEIDERIMRERFGIRHTSSVPTGVDLDYFEPPSGVEKHFDLVFIGSMDWMPNIDGVRWFLDEVLPLIRANKPNCRVAIVGRNPPPSLTAGAKDPLIKITGTVADVRPFLWQSALSIVPLCVGGGTRLKIFESLAAGTPVVSTTIGAEGLPLKHGKTIRIGDTGQEFAAECLNLLNDPDARQGMSSAGLELVREKFSWDRAVRRFEDILAGIRDPV